MNVAFTGRGSKMKTIFAYIRLYYQYAQTPKGRHDLVDYTRAILIIAVSIAIVLILVGIICGK